ncbi:MAG: ComF family protein [Bacteroidales bacterium]|jgi:ComF family protein|nr:ComF family protein [Bacteroidales bacterium]
MLKDLVNLLYPLQCLACEKTLHQNETLICLECLFHLPKTNFHNDPSNAVCRLFWGRAKVEMATAFLFFSKSGKVQHLIHQLKYNKKPEIGIYLGKLFGKDLLKSLNFQGIDVIIPVPLHPKKIKIRGYNQSDKIAFGLSQTMNVSVDTISFVRGIATETQTRKNRFSRWENVKDVFAVADENTLKNKHILLVDDVITTGATIEGCIRKLTAIEGVRVSVVSLAIPTT